MTSDEIKNENKLDSQYFWIWLKECAYQLAVMNERNASGDQRAVDEMLKKVGLGSTVPPGSDSALRRDTHYCYVARNPCGCATAAVVDDPMYAEETAADVAGYIRSGRTVERIQSKSFDTGSLGCVHEGPPVGGLLTPDLADEPNSTQKESCYGTVQRLRSRLHLWRQDPNQIQRRHVREMRPRDPPGILADTTHPHR